MKIPVYAEHHLLYLLMQNMALALVFLQLIALKPVQAIINDKCNTNDLVKPGHIFPLQAKEGGVFERQGHTEGAIDLVQLSRI